MRIVRHRIISMILAMVLVFGMTTGVLADLERPDGLKLTNDKLIGFEGVKELEGNLRPVNIIVELSQQPEELERILSSNKGNMALFSNKEEKKSR